MAESLTSDQVREDHVARMGPDLGPVYHALWNETAWLHAKWHEFTELYGASAARVEILNKAATWFFRIVQEALWEDTLLHLARLTDAPNMRGKKNLTFRGLPRLVKDADLRAELTDLIAKTKFARDWRNRRIAHRDLALALGAPATPLAEASRAHVAGALRALVAVLDRVNTHFSGSRTMLDQMITPMTGGVRLLHVVRDGLEADERRFARLRAGTPEPGDIEPARTI